MSKNVKTVLIVAVVLFVVAMLGCGALAYIGSKMPASPTDILEEATPTTEEIIIQPTYTPLPTLTPYPTQKPLPTQKPRPTKEPTADTSGMSISDALAVAGVSGVDEIDCPSSLDTPDGLGIASRECFSIDGTSGVGAMFYNSRGELLIMTATTDYDHAYTAGQLLGVAAYLYGWDVDDVVSLIEDAGYEFDTNHYRGDLIGRGEFDADGITLVIALASIFD